MSNTHLIDLRSDTVTKPSAQMREVMAAAEVAMMFMVKIRPLTP